MRLNNVWNMETADLLKQNFKYMLYFINPLKFGLKVLFDRIGFRNDPAGGEGNLKTLVYLCNFRQFISESRGRDWWRGQLSGVGKGMRGAVTARVARPLSPA